MFITHDHAIAERMPRKIEILDGQIIADTRPAAAANQRSRPSTPSTHPSGATPHSELPVGEERP